jgi:hypothetical protein
MRFWAVVLLPLGMVSLSGCAPAAFSNPAGLQGVASMIESVGSTATGFKASQSAVELNSANKGLLEAQTSQMRDSVEQSADDHKRTAHERVVTAKLLREMSATYHDRVLETMAEWVEAGGDPDFAFKYALTRVEDGERMKAIPQQTLSLKQQPQLTQPALHPPQKGEAETATQNNSHAVATANSVEPAGNN